MKKSSHHHSVSKTKPEKNERKQKHEGSVSNIKHKASTMGSSEFKKTKVKTQASHSKSKSRTDKGKIIKLKSKQQPLKPRLKGSYDITHMQSKDKPPSNTNTDRRRSSIKTHQKTDFHYQQPDMQLRISEIRNSLSQLPSPSSDIKELKHYYNSILQIIGDSQDPLHSMLLILHSVYTAPMQQMFDIMLPYENLLLRRNQIFHQIQSQVEKNKSLFEEVNLSFDRLQIQKLQAIISAQKQQIEQRKNINQYDIQLLRQQSDQEIIETELKKKDLKIDLGMLKDHKPMGYHEQFLSHLPEMSQSWRNQAIKQKRY